MLTIYKLPDYKLLLVSNLMHFLEKSKMENLNSLKFIDNHTHGAFGVDFNYASYNEIKFLLKELFKRNIVGVCPTLVGDNTENIQKQLKIFKQIKLEQLNKISNEALLIGAHLEGSFLNKEKSGIQDSKNFLVPSIENLKSLTGDFEDIIKVVTIAPEIDINLIDYLNDKNIKTQAGHTLGNELKNCRATTHHFCAMKTMHHRDPSIALTGLINDDIYCEIIADLIHTSKEMLNLFLKAKPKDKVLLVSDSLPISHYDKDIIFCGKKINKFGLDSSNTLAGSIKTLDEICFNLIKENILSTSDINKMAFENQIRYLNLSNKEIDILNS